MSMIDAIAATDSYKIGHYPMYPEGTEKVMAYFESRQKSKFDKTVFFGLQYLIKRYFVGQVVDQDGIEEMAPLMAQHFGDDTVFNRAGWEYILKKHGGRLPLEVCAIPEGTPVPVSNALMTVINTDPNCHWLTNYFESSLTHVWSSTTVASLSYRAREIIAEFLERTSENPGAVMFMLHDFGYRGVSSEESSAIEGLGHLVNFLGTDTVPALVCAKRYYGAKEAVGYSVRATEHSIMTSCGPEGEPLLVERLLNTCPIDKILSCVADSFNYYRFVEEYVCKRFRDKILARKMPFVVRPDSCTSDHPTPESLVVWTLEKLADAFGYETNKKGFKVINPCVRVLWGDGIDLDGIVKILAAAEKAGFSAENLVFGMGGGLLQKINRDTLDVAFKCCAQYRNGQWIVVRKNPLDQSKASKGGRLGLIMADGQYRTIDMDTLQGASHGFQNQLVPVFRNGELLVEYDFDQVRANAWGK